MDNMRENSLDMAHRLLMVEGRLPYCMQMMGGNNIMIGVIEVKATRPLPRRYK